MKHWTWIKHRHVCTHSDEFYMLIPNMDMKCNIFEILNIFTEQNCVMCKSIPTITGPSMYLFVLIMIHLFFHHSADHFFF